MKYVMKFEAKHAGKWVATHNEKVIESAKTLNALKEKTKNKKESESFFYTRLPRGLIAG